MPKTREFDWMLQRPDGTVLRGRSAGRKRTDLPADAAGVLFVYDEQGAWRIDLTTGECRLNGEVATPPASLKLKTGKTLKKGGDGKWSLR